MMRTRSIQRMAARSFNRVINSPSFSSPFSRVPLLSSRSSVLLQALTLENVARSFSSDPLPSAPDAPEAPKPTPRLSDGPASFDFLGTTFQPVWRFPLPASDHSESYEFLPVGDSLSEWRTLCSTHKITPEEKILKTPTADLAQQFAQSKLSLGAKITNALVFGSSEAEDSNIYMLEFTIKAPNFVEWTVATIRKTSTTIYQLNFAIRLPLEKLEEFQKSPEHANICRTVAKLEFPY